MHSRTQTRRPTADAGAVEAAGEVARASAPVSADPDPPQRAPAPQPEAKRLEAATLALLARRGPAASICPSEVARACAPDDWRVLMPAVRASALLLAREGRILITRGAHTLMPPELGRGPIRLRRGPRFALPER